MLRMLELSMLLDKAEVFLFNRSGRASNDEDSNHQPANTHATFLYLRTIATFTTTLAGWSDLLQPKICYIFYMTSTISVYEDRRYVSVRMHIVTNIHRLCLVLQLEERIFNDFRVFKINNVPNL